MRAATLRYPTSLEAVDFTHPRRLNRQQVLTLGSCTWIADRHNLLIPVPTGIGRSFLACGFVERACRRGFTAAYVRLPRLLHQLAVGRGDGSYTRLLARVAKLDLLAIDDWLLAPLRDAERRDLTEGIEDRAGRAHRRRPRRSRHGSAAHRPAVAKGAEFKPERPATSTKTVD